MHVGILGLQFQPGAMGGVENYLRLLPLAGSHFLGDDRLTLLGGPCNEEILREMTGRCAYQTVHPTFGQLLRRASIFLGHNLSGRSYLGQLEDRVTLEGFDIVHYPFSVLLPHVTSRHKLKTVVTIHDLQHVEYPTFFSKAELTYREREYARAAHEADLVSTDSEYSRKMIIARYHIVPERVKVHYPGIDVEYFRGVDEVAVSGYLAKHGIHNRYLLYPAAPWPHKNHDRLLLALKRITIQRDFKGSLVLCGVYNSFRRNLEKLIVENGLVDFVKVLGYVSRGDLRLLYSGATALVYPSLYEGFGFPVLEAMASGTPVICSNRTSLPELGGDCVRYIEPTDVTSIMEGIVAVWGDASTQLKYRDLGTKHVDKFNLVNASENLYRLYRTLYDNQQ